jgi:transketolase
MSQNNSELTIEAPLNIGLDERSVYLRSLVLRALEGGDRGHIGSSVSPMEVLRVLYDSVLKHDAHNPAWPERDRFIMSKGHGCLALYALLADYQYFDMDELDRFCLPGGILGGHPERSKVPGVEASTGALGHGLSIGVGQALAARIQERNSRIFVLMGDGEINEGSVWEAAMSASKHGLDNLTAIVDYNKIQSAGPTKEIMDLEPLADKWRAFGFAVKEVNGHDVTELEKMSASLPFEAGKPSLIIAHTIKGKGFDFAENDPAWHHKAKLGGGILRDLQQALSDYPRLALTQKK